MFCMVRAHNCQPHAATCIAHRMRFHMCPSWNSITRQPHAATGIAHRIRFHMHTRPRLPQRYACIGTRMLPSPASGNFASGSASGCLSRYYGGPPQPSEYMSTTHIVHRQHATLRCAHAFTATPMSIVVPRCHIHRPSDALSHAYLFTCIHMLVGHRCWLYMFLTPSSHLAWSHCQGSSGRRVGPLPQLLVQRAPRAMQCSL